MKIKNKYPNKLQSILKFTFYIKLSRVEDHSESKYSETNIPPKYILANFPNAFRI